MPPLYYDDDPIPDRFDDCDEPRGRGRTPRGCGGHANYTGPCGATDCPSCYPFSWDRDEEEE